MQRRTLLAAAAATLATPAIAQEFNQTVRIIVPNPAGVAMDAIARLYGERLAARWGQAVVVENLPGADGIMVEVHRDPANALSDGAQSLDPQGFAAMMTALRPVAAAVGRPLA